MPQVDWKKILSKEGLFAILFVIILYWTYTANDNREKRYMDMIDTLNQDIGKSLVELKAMHQKST